MALAAAIAIALASCARIDGGTGTESSDGEGAVITTERTVRTNSKGQPIPDVLGDMTVELGPEPEAEKPITNADSVRSYHNGHKALTYVNGSGKYRNLDGWGNEDRVDYLFDGKDGYFKPGEQSKLGGIVSNGELVIEFRTEKAVLVGYAFVTGNDSGNYKERSPKEWYLYGSNDGKEWTLLDHVENSGIYAVDHGYFGYGIDESVRGEYSHYRVRFTKNISDGQFGDFQLNEMYLYK